MKKQFFRVKQLADQTFLRADKTEVLNNEELNLADQRIEYLRTSVSSILKKIPHTGQSNDIEKRIKKSTEHPLALAFLEQCELPEHPTRLFSPVIQKCGNVQQDLAKEYADYEKQVEDLVSEPLQKLLDNDFHNILKQKRNLSKYILDKDAASNRYNATKKEALKDDMEEADYKVEQSRDVLAYEMFTLLAKENDLAGYMLQILKCQRAYHECALNRLKDVIPQLEKQIGDSDVKRVYGIPLQEHLRVTNRRIALPLEICITLLHKHGLNEEGLFRIAGSNSRVKRLKSSIDSGCFNAKVAEYLDVHVLASALKLYLRELTEPLLTAKLYNDWILAMQKPENERIETVKVLLGKLPQENRENLAILMQFLTEVTHHPETRMSSSNIAIVMAPNLLWDGNEVTNMGNCAAVNMLVELFIKEAQLFFPEDLTKLLNFQWPDDGGFIKTTIEFNISSENVAESPRPNSRKKKTPAPIPPSKTDELYQNEINTLGRKKVLKASIGINTDDSLVIDSKTAQKIVTATPIQVSKAKPVIPAVAQNACDKEKPVAAPRSLDAVTRSSSIRIELRNDEAQPRPLKPEVPARPASLAKRPSVDIDPATLQRTQCSVYSVANRQQPSYVNVQNREKSFQPLGHDTQIAEKEKFLGHTKDINCNSRCSLPPKVIKSEASKSNEDLGEIGESKMNGNQKTSHVRTRSDGNLIELGGGGSGMQTPPSPRSLNKPTQPPPPPPIKKEADSTDL